VNEITSLILQTRADDITAKRAMARLVVAGATAAPQVMEAIRSGAGMAWRLCAVLKSIRDSDVVPLLIAALQDPNADLVIAAFEGLGNSGDSRALAPLLQELGGRRQTLAAEALGNLGDGRAIPALLRAADEIMRDPGFAPVFQGQAGSVSAEVDESSLRDFPTIVIALAKLGNDEAATALIPLSQYRSDDAYSDDEVIRTNAVAGVQHVVVPGTLACLQRALADPYVECRLNAVDALFYLGSKGAIGELAKAAWDPNGAFSTRVELRLRDLTGTDFSADSSVERRSAWWSARQGQYTDGICYRLGHPMDISEVIELLADPHQRSTILTELRIVTGVGFGSLLDEEADMSQHRAQEWWRGRSGSFTRGGLYKYGRRQSLDRLS